ncbi:hypothetical protein ABK040_000332 [Willaertia magna]
MYSLNNLFKCNKIILRNDIPKYLSDNLQYLQIMISNNCNLSLKQCIKLKSLFVHDCDIQDETLKEMLSLEELKVKNCEDLKGKCFNNLKNLKLLKVKSSFIVDKDLNELQNLTQLSLKECINLEGKFLHNFNQLTSLSIKNSCAIDFFYLTSLINLKKLKLCDNGACNYEFLTDLINLESLTISTMGAVHDSDLKGLQNLKRLDLACYSFYHFTGDCFHNLKNLEILYLSGFLHLNGENFRFSTNLTELKFFDKPDFSIKHLNNLKKLSTLKFLLQDKTDEDELLQLQNSVTNLDVSESANFIGKCLINFTNLTKLNVAYTDVEGKYLKNLQNLTNLNLSNCHSVKGECLLNLHNLTKLNINNTKISDKYLLHLTKVRKLSIADCFKIVFGEFLLNMNSLTRLVCQYRQYIVLQTSDDIFLLKSLIREGKNLREATTEMFGSDNDEEINDDSQ